MKFNLASILAKVGFTNKSAKRDTRTYGYAPASPLELAVWNAGVDAAKRAKKAR